MKNLGIILVTLFITQLFAQDITNKLGGNTANETYDVTDSADNVLMRVQGDGKAMIGTTSSSSKFSVESDGSTAIYGNQSSNTGSTYGVYGNSNAATGAGVKGTAGPTGANFGGHFTSPAMEGTGVYGQGTKYSGYFKQGDFVIETGDVGIGTIAPDATLDVHGTVKAFGVWDASLSFGTVYTATTDGFVVAYSNIGGSSELIGITDSSAPPTTVRTIAERSDPGHINIIMPVKKDDMWKVDRTGVTASGSLFWIPLGQ